MGQLDFETMIADGWGPVIPSEYTDLIGPIWQRCVNGQWEFTMYCDAKHRNINGVVHGGVLMSFADQAMGRTAAPLHSPLSTVQLDSQFVDVARIGEFLRAAPRVVRDTKSLFFMSTDIYSGDRLVTIASGLWKKLKPV